MQERDPTILARSLINDPDLVFADEPTGNLDRESANQVMELIRSFNRTNTTSFMISTHEERIAAQCGRRIEVLDGRIIRS